MPDENRLFERLEGPSRRGMATEAIVVAEFILRDIPVLTPRTDTRPYDIVIDVDGAFHRIQIKTAYGGPDTVQFETVSTQRRRDGYRRNDYDGSVDWFAVYNPSERHIYLIHLNETAKGKMSIRLTDADNNQRVGVNWYEDFLLDNRLRRLRTDEQVLLSE